MSYEVSRVARYGGAVSLILGDIDHFKRVNDTWGHDFGDKVLQGVAHAMSGAIRESDLLGRVGGEEFAVVLPQTDAHGAAIVARKLLEAVFGTPYAAPDGTTQHFTISLGLAFVAGPHAERVDPEVVSSRMYKAADKALYASKHGGRNRVSGHNKPLPWTRPKPQ